MSLRWLELIDIFGCAGSYFLRFRTQASVLRIIINPFNSSEPMSRSHARTLTITCASYLARTTLASHSQNFISAYAQYITAFGTRVLPHSLPLFCRFPARKVFGGVWVGGLFCGYKTSSLLPLNRVLVYGVYKAVLQGYSHAIRSIPSIRH